MVWYEYSAITVVALAAIGLLQKKTLKREHSLEYLMILGFLKLLFLIIGFGPRIDVGVSSEFFFLLGLDGFIGGFALLLIAKAIRIGELSIVLPILSIEPALVALLAFLTLGESLTSGAVVGLLFVLFGTYILELRREEHWWVSARSHPLSLLRPFSDLMRTRAGYLTFLSLLFFSVSSVLDRYLLLHIKTGTYLLYNYTFSAVLFIVLFLATRQKVEFLYKDHRPILLAIAGIASLTLLANFSQARALALAAVGLVIAVKRIFVLIDVILCGRFFHERNIAQKSIATVIILAGLYFILKP